MSGVALLFALRLLAIYGCPLEYGLEAYEVAVRQGVDPEAVGAALVSEHRGSGTYDTLAESGAGAVGLYQLWPGWAANDAIGTNYEVEDLLDWRINTEVAVLAIAWMQSYHRLHCTQSHTWNAHYKCSREGLDKCEAAKRMEQIEKQLGGK
jgi:hypothetical protein